MVFMKELSFYWEEQFQSSTSENRVITMNQNLYLDNTKQSKVLAHPFDINNYRISHPQTSNFEVW